VCAAFADRLQHAYTKVGSFAFAGFPFLLRFFGGFFLTLRQNVPFHHDLLAKVCIQVDLLTLRLYILPFFCASQTSPGSSPLTKQPVICTALAGSLADRVCASPVSRARLDTTIRVKNTPIG